MLYCLLCRFYRRALSEVASATEAEVLVTNDKATEFLHSISPALKDLNYQVVDKK